MHKSYIADRILCMCVCAVSYAACRLTGRIAAQDEFAPRVMTSYSVVSDDHTHKAHMTCSWLGKSALSLHVGGQAVGHRGHATALPEVGTVPYGRCCGRGRLSRCGFRSCG